MDGEARRPRVLVVRSDRIGDLVHSFPALRSLSGARPAPHVALLAREKNREIASLAPGVEEVVGWPGRGVVALSRTLRARAFDAAVFLRLDVPITVAAFLAGIPIRVGPASHADSLLLTHRLVQRRHQSVRSEASYNLEIASRALNLLELVSSGQADPGDAGVDLPAGVDARALAWLEGAFGPPDGTKIVGIHPGSGGSSRNWSSERYAALGRAIDVARLARVVVTGGPDEEGLVERVAGRIGPGTPVYLGTRGQKEAWALFSRLDALVSGSTGPMHLASAAGTSAVALFSPVIACSPLRWGALGPGPAVNLVPPVPPCERCVEARCPYLDCMDRIEVGQVLDALSRQIGGAGRPRREMARSALRGAPAGDGHGNGCGFGVAHEAGLQAR